MHAQAVTLAYAVAATSGAAPSGDATPWAGAALAAAVGIVAVTATGVGLAVRRRRRGNEPQPRTGPLSEVVVPPDVAAALERRTLRRGRLRLTDEGVAGSREPGTKAAD